MLKYDDEKQTLSIHFYKSRTLTYISVPSEVWVDFLEADDVDEFYVQFADEFDTLAD
jgi:hypothetical protein